MNNSVTSFSRRGFAFELGTALFAAAAWAPRRAWSAAATGVPKEGAPQVLLASVGAPDIDPQGRLVSEKFDGVRALWDGERLRFRSGRPVGAPAWFIERLPRLPLDGELWLRRGGFEALSGIVRKQVPIDDEWRNVHYLIFELPGGAGSFSDRAAEIRRVVDAAAWPALQAVAQRVVPDRAALHALLEAVVHSGGEGLVLHRADAAYTTGRGEVLQKLKPADDDEATVVGHVAGRGKYLGRLGALAVQAADGRRILIGTGFSDAQRADPPPLGAQVTYTYRGVTRTGMPRFASFLRVHESL